jgi:hypothetical protein
MAPPYRRPDGSYVIAGPLGPYHVTLDDPAFPAVAAELDGQVLDEEPQPPAVPAAPALIAKTAIYRRCTDEELELLEAFLAGSATPRQRLMWRDAEGGLVLLDDVTPLFVAAVGAERAAELLAP